MAAALEIDLSLVVGKVDDLCERMDALVRRLQVRPYWTPPASVTTPGSGQATYYFLDLGGPPAPHLVWDVRRIYVYGTDPFATLSGVQVIGYVGPNAPSPTSTEPNFPNLAVDPGGVPNVAPFKDQLTLWNPDHLILALKSLGTSQQVIGGMQVEQYEISRFQPGR